MLSTPIRQHHLLMFDFGVLPERTMKIVVSQGRLSLSAVYIDAYTGERVRETHINLIGQVELHFTASDKDKFAGLWYMQQYDRSGKCWRCTCLECKQCGTCLHLEPFYPLVVA